jgi:hypothetical protein
LQPTAARGSALADIEPWKRSAVTELDRSARKTMAIPVKIIGVHPIEADEPVHLIEILFEGDTDAFDIGEVTQEVTGQPKSNWQAPYHERVLEKSANKIRLAFFFHYLDFKKPLLTPAGSLPLPRPTKQPTHLLHIAYEAP